MWTVRSAVLVSLRRRETLSSCGDRSWGAGAWGVCFSNLWCAVVNWVKLKRDPIVVRFVHAATGEDPEGAKERSPKMPRSVDGLYCTKALACVYKQSCPALSGFAVSQQKGGTNRSEKLINGHKPQFNKRRSITARPSLPTTLPSLHLLSAWFILFMRYTCPGLCSSRDIITGV